MSKNKYFSGGLSASGKPRALTIRETPLSAQIAEWLDARRIYNACLNGGKAETKRGNRLTLCRTETPDRFAILSGNIIFIAVKKFGAASSAARRAKHDELREAGAIVIETASIENFIIQFSAIRAAVHEREKETNLYD